MEKEGKILGKLELDEIEGMKNDSASFKNKEEVKMNEFARELNEGLGERMINDLNTNNCVRVERGFRYSFRVWWKRFKEDLNMWFFN